jgi:hypothetical protein
MFDQLAGPAFDWATARSAVADVALASSTTCYLESLLRQGAAGSLLAEPVPDAEGEGGNGAGGARSHCTPSLLWSCWHLLS